MDDDKRDLERRRDQLGKKLSQLDQVAGEDAERGRTAYSTRKGASEAMKLSSEFLSAIIAGAIIGYLIDRFAGTTPWAMIAMVLLGFVAGVLNVLRFVGKVSAPHPMDKDPLDRK